MDLRRVTPSYFVSPQLVPADLRHVAEAGITTIICNRPDSEVPPDLAAAAMEDAARDAGLAFVRLPLTHQTMTPDNIALQARTVADAPGPVLAYCASGTRSCVAWALGQAGRMKTAEIIAAAREAGYDLAALGPALDAAAQARTSG